MTPGDNGASAPEDDDPFGYLYADGQARGAQPPSSGYGYPNSVGRARPVGERTYGGQQAQYGQTVPQQQTASYGQPSPHGQPNAHYQAPETVPGGAGPRQPMPPSGGDNDGGRGRGPNTKGLLIGAVAVVAAVVIGISLAVINGNSDDDKSGDHAGSTATQSQSSAPKPSSSGKGSGSDELPKTDAKTLRLEGGTTTASEFEGAKADGGVYVTGFNQVGAKVTWTTDVQKAGTYRLYVRYGVPGTDASATLQVNGKDSPQPLNMKNFGNTPKGDWAKGWKTTWANVNLTAGTNTIVVACAAGNQCDAVLDQFSITK
ncbi:CBM35 domain-containing protein [Streptomyces sp. NPDC086787]|uniref:CBM35 domain-containing protein n=1 Tax=Streptomyces sp. NPDC086787 TaxID=3365759 RepID=UPI0037F39503